MGSVTRALSAALESMAPHLLTYVPSYYSLKFGNMARWMDIQTDACEELLEAVVVGGMKHVFIRGATYNHTFLSFKASTA